MNKEIKIKAGVSLAIFLFINFLFSIKYLERASENYLFISALIFLLYIVFWNTKGVLIKINPYLKWINLIAVSGFIMGSAYVFNLIPVETLNVDRWSIITGFWDTALSGDYAYFGKGHSGNPPGPMPFYFLLAFPFYLIKELGFYSLLGIVAFYGLLHYSKVPEHLKTIGILLILTSVFYLWEVVSRSNVFINAVLILFSVVYILRQEKFNSKNILISGVFTGLLLSTRNVFIIPYIITFLFLLRTKKINLPQVLKLGSIAFLFFILTFLPVVIGHFDDFLIMNPFIVQSTFLIPFEYTLGFILIAVLLSLACKTNGDVFFYSGLTLFLSILIYFLYHIILSGFEAAYFESRVDISYFILCVPFVVYFLLKSEKAV